MVPMARTSASLKRSQKLLLQVIMHVSFLIPWFVWVEELKLLNTHAWLAYGDYPEVDTTNTAPVELPTAYGNYGTYREYKNWDVILVGMKWR